MGRRKIREEKSKLHGTKSVLKTLNTAAHEQAHNNPNAASPTVANYGSDWKWAGR